MEQKAQPVQTGLEETGSWDDSCSLDLLTRILTPSCPPLSFPPAREARYDPAKLHAGSCSHIPPPSKDTCRRGSSANRCLKVQLQHLGVRVSGSGKGEGGSFWTESHVIGERKKEGSTSCPKQSPSPWRSFLQYQNTDPSLIPLARGKGWMWSPPPQLPCFSITYPDVFLALIPTGMSLCNRALCLRASA